MVRRNWTKLPVPNDVIIRIKKLAEETSGLNVENFFGDEEEVETETMNDSVEEDEQVAENLTNEFRNKESASDEIIDVMMDETMNENVEGLVENKGSTDYVGDKDTRSLQEQEVTHGYNLRSSRVRDYSYKFSFLSVNAELKRWGEDAKKALNDKLNLFIKEEVLVGVEYPNEAQKKNTLRTHCFIASREKGWPYQGKSSSRRKITRALLGRGDIFAHGMP